MNKMKNDLRQLAINASKGAYSPYSKAHVGCALLTNTEKIYSGCNIENSSYGATVCAERVAIFKAISDIQENKNKNKDKELKINTIYIYTDDGWPPCGICRQVMSEFASDQLQVIIGDKNKNEKEISFADILPYQYNKSYLIK